MIITKKIKAMGVAWLGSKEGKRRNRKKGLRQYLKRLQIEYGG